MVDPHDECRRFADPMPAPSPRAWKRPWCWITGHDFRVVREHPSAMAVVGLLHPFAGCDAQCARCGAWWRDHDAFATILESIQAAQR